MIKIDLPAYEINRKYLDDRRNMEELAEEYGVSASKIKNLLKENGIRLRNRSEIQLDGKTLPVKRIAMEYNYGQSALSLGKKYGVSNVTIQDILKKEGVNIRSISEARLKGKVLPIDEIKKRYLEDRLDSKQLGSEYGVSDVHIRNFLRNNGVKLRSISEARLKGKVLPIDEIKKRYLEDKMNLEELAEEYGVSASKIKNLLKEKGVKLRNYSEAILKGKILPVEEIKKKYLNGSSINELSREYDSSWDRIKELLKKNGIKIKNNSSLEQQIQAYAGKQSNPRTVAELNQ
jgi:predicted DNA-binding protein YlxM (UPF0122 family)